MKFLKIFFLIALLVAGSARMLWVADQHSTDLHVYWKSARLCLEGISPYIYDSSDGGNVYKYPPWTIPMFFPLGFVGFDFTKWIWVVAEIFSIAYAVRWVIRAGANSVTTVLIAVLFWWIWLGHVFAGQFSLFMLLAALWAVPPQEEQALSSPKLAVLAVVFSSKVYSIFTLLGLLKNYLKPRTFVICLSLIVFLEGVVFAVLRARGNPVSLLELHRTWVIAAESGAAELHANVIRGTGNHSFTAALLRWFQVDALDSSKDTLVALGVGLFFSALWFYFSKACLRSERWAGWIGVGMVAHPLLWHHSIVMAFPVCALAMDRSIRSKNVMLIALASSSVFLVALLIPNLFGPDFVYPFEYLGSKSWGILLTGTVLVINSRQLLKNPKSAHPVAQPS